MHKDDYDHRYNNDDSDEKPDSNLLLRCRYRDIGLKGETSLLKEKKRKLVSVCFFFGLVM